jgi:hypothetical protein
LPLCPAGSTGRRSRAQSPAAAGVQPERAGIRFGTSVIDHVCHGLVHREDEIDNPVGRPEELFARAAEGVDVKIRHGISQWSVHRFEAPRHCW